MKYLITSVECACSKGQRADSFVLTGPGRISREKQRPENVFRKSPFDDYCVTARRSLFASTLVLVCVSMNIAWYGERALYFITLFLVFFLSFLDNHGVLVM